MDDVVISIICTNNAKVLRGCLEALPAACEGIAWRLTVIDNASMDGASEVVLEVLPEAGLIRNDRRHGFSHNHNLVLLPALEKHAARYLMVLNDDTRLDPGSVAAMVDEMDRDSGIGALGPRMRGPDNVPQQSLLPFDSVVVMVVRQFRSGLPPSQPKGAGWLNGSCILMRYEALIDVGSLDERYFIFYEDTDIGRRLQARGWRSAVSEHGGMVHMEHQTVTMPEMSSVMARQMLRSQWLYVVKHSGRWAGIAVAATTRTALMLRLVKALIEAAAGDCAARSAARNLASLMTYSPNRPLPHELAP